MCYVTILRWSAVPTVGLYRRSVNGVTLLGLSDVGVVAPSPGSVDGGLSIK